jgi:electron transport complex protein RnfG
VGAFQLTLPTITSNKAKALRAAVFEVVPGAKQMQPMVWDGSALAVAAKDVVGSTIYASYDSAGVFMGYAIPAEGPGFQDNIRLIYGYLPGTKRIVGMKVLESRETPGLGDKIYKDDKFVGEFRDLAVEPQVVVVKGHGADPNQVDAITGATISSKSVVKIVNAGNESWLPRLPAPGQEPPPPGKGGL